MAIGDKIYIADKLTLDAVGKKADDIQSKIGIPNAVPSGSPTTGSVFAKINWILENWTKTGTIPIVKSIQKGVVMFPNKNNISITISTVNPQKAFVLLNNSFIGTSYSSTNTYGASLVELTTTTLVLTASYADVSGQLGANNPVSYQIVEYY